MNILLRILERIFITCVVLAVLWFLITQVFDRLDEQMPIFFAATLTYLVAAYLLLPRVIQLSLMILRRGRIPRVTRTADGLPADPVNIIFVGSEQDLKQAFADAQWNETDTLNIKTGWKMMQTFARNQPYARAPFSALYLFGRKQDHGFQQPIGKSPRKRHHIRFWAANLDPNIDWTDIHYWISKHTIQPSETFMWVGSGTKDTGIGLTRLSYQITHSTDKNVDEEREYILNSIQKAGWIEKQEYIEAGKFVSKKYTSDGKILLAYLKRPKTSTHTNR